MLPVIVRSAVELGKQALNGRSVSSSGKFTDLCKRLKKHMGGMAEEVDLKVPGRLCVLGEHSDWAGGQFRSVDPDVVPGKAIVISTSELALKGKAKTKQAQVLHAESKVSSEEWKKLQVDATGEDLLKIAQGGGFWSYVAGVAYWITLEHDIAGGVHVSIHSSTLPMNSGLSSSAAVCVLVAEAYNRLYHLKLSTRGVMEYAYRGEQLTPSNCGRMDQACAFPQPVLLTFDGPLLHCEPIQLKCDLHFVVVDLLAPKDTSLILRSLQHAYSHDTHTEGNKAVRRLFGSTNDQRCTLAVEAMKAGSPADLGAQMTLAQDDFDKYAAPKCPQELTAPKLHAVLQHEGVQKHIYGAKGVGSQGDGSAQLLCRSEDDMRLVCGLLQGMDVKCMMLTIPATSAAGESP